jgi:hypothetical protein
MPRPRFFWGFLTILLAGFCTASHAQDQQPAPPQEQQAPAASQSPAQPEYKKGPHASDTLIRGTVFSDKAMALPRAQLRLRRAGEKKFRWEKFSNSRGEFGVYVPQGSSYEIVVRLKGFAELNQTVEAKAGAEEERIVLHMAPAAGGKK